MNFYKRSINKFHVDMFYNSRFAIAICNSKKKNRTNIEANTYEIADALSFNANFRRQNVIANFEGDRINLNSVRECHITT